MAEIHTLFEQCAWSKRKRQRIMIGLLSEVGIKGKIKLVFMPYNQADWTNSSLTLLPLLLRSSPSCDGLPG